MQEVHEGFWSSDGANVGIAGRTLICDDVLQATCRMDRMGRNAVDVVADALAAKVHDPLSCHGSSAGPASRDTPRREWRTPKVTPNRLWSSRGHCPESPLYCDEDVAGIISRTLDGIGVVVMILM